MKKTTKGLLDEARARAKAELIARGWKGPGHGLVIKVKVTKPPMGGAR